MLKNVFKLIIRSGKGERDKNKKRRGRPTALCASRARPVAEVTVLRLTLNSNSRMGQFLARIYKDEGLTTKGVFL